MRSLPIPKTPELFTLVLPMSLAVITVYWQVAPVVSASMGASLDLKKLIVYPIPRERLFTVEILLRLTTCAEMLLPLVGIICGNAAQSPHRRLAECTPGC